MKTLKEMFLRRYDLLGKYLVAFQFPETKDKTRPLSHADIDY